MMPLWGLVYRGINMVLVGSVAKVIMAVLLPFASFYGSVSLQRNFKKSLQKGGHQIYNRQLVIYDCVSKADHHSDPQTQIPHVLRDLNYLLAGDLRTMTVLVRNDADLRIHGFDIPLR